MKRLFCFFLLLVLLSGCSNAGRQQENTVAFYYLREEYQSDYVREEYQFDMPEAVIAAEERTVTSQLHRITYLLSLYLDGPLDSALRSPLPEDTKLEYISWKNDQLEISLLGSFSALSDMDLTLARACITFTCLELTVANTICIITTDPIAEETETVILDRNQFLFSDDVRSTESTATP